MQTTITTRHCEVPETLRERANTVMERLGNLASHPMEMTVVFDADGIRAEEKLRRQVERVSDRRRARPAQPNNPV